MTSSEVTVQKVEALSILFDARADLEIVAIDVPIGLLDYYVWREVRHPALCRTEPILPFFLNCL
jgi:hypothetical protein